MHVLVQGWCVKGDRTHTSSKLFLFASLIFSLNKATTKKAGVLLKSDVNGICEHAISCLEFRVSHMTLYVLHSHSALVFWQSGQSLTMTSKPPLFHQGPQKLWATGWYEVSERWREPPRDRLSSLLALLIEWKPPQRQTETHPQQICSTQALQIAFLQLYCHATTWEAQRARFADRAWPLVAISGSCSGVTSSWHLCKSQNCWKKNS